MSLDCSVDVPASDPKEDSNDTSPPLYQYCPLPSSGFIRLIGLLPGKDCDPICCSLSTVNLEETPPFEALSYVWGDAKNTKQIFCFDHGNAPQTAKPTLQVTLNCWHALHRLRLEGLTRQLWIDAICINQKDLKERNQQVVLMGNLYRKAASVPVYLGQDEDLPGVFQLFRDLTIKATSFPIGILPSAFSDIDRSLLISFRKFFERPWFKRCWTMQEIGLAQRAMLICDGDELEWDVFFSVICWINRSQHLDVIHLDLPINELVTSVSLYTAFEKGETGSFKRLPDFLDVLNATRNRQATEPKDRIYAFLGHTTAVDEEGPLVVPYYSQWDWIVFYQFVLTYIKRTRNLRILSLVDHGKNLPVGFPLSWVPWCNPSSYLRNFGMSSGLYDASAGSKQSPTIQLGGDRIEDLDIDQVLEDSPLLEWEYFMMWSSASEESIKIAHQKVFSNLMTRQISKRSFDFSLDTALSLYQPEESKLSVRGLILDEIRLVWPVFDKTDIALHSFSKEIGPKKHFVEILCNSLPEDGFPSRYDDYLLALSLTLVGGVQGLNVAKEDLNMHRASFEAYRHAIQTSRVIISDTKEKTLETTGEMNATMDKNPRQPSSISRWEKFMTDAVKACHHRRFFTTKSGFFGLGPEAMLGKGIEPGKSIVAILFGANVPFILQKTGDTYCLVGEAYVHGVMNGEAVEMWKRGDLEEVDFQLF